MPNMAKWCCCGDCVLGEVCTHCDDVSVGGPAPAQYKVLISGSTKCTGCRTDDSTGSFVRVSYINSFDLNDEFTLTESSCEWTYTYPNAIRWQVFSSDACSGTPTIYIEDVLVRLRRFATTWELSVTTTYVPGGVAPDLFRSNLVAADTDGSKQLCFTVPVLGSNLVSSACTDSAGDGPGVSYGGDATVTCV